MNRRPYLRVGGVTVLAAAVAALGAPQYRSTVERVALFVLAVIAAVALVDVIRHRSPLPARSPFEPRRVRPARPGVPIDLERAAVDIRAFDAALDRGPAVAPGGLRRTARAIAASRLAGHRGVRLDDPEAQAAAAAVCGPELWALLEGQPTQLDPDRLVVALEQL